MAEPDPIFRTLKVFTTILLTLLWLGVMMALALHLLGASLDASYPDPIPRQGVTHRAETFALWLCVVAAGGPTIIAIAVAAMRMRATAIVFAVLAVILAMPGLYLAATAYRDRPQPVPSGPTHCVELSGGDNRCPGG